MARSTKARAVVSVFRIRADAERAVEELRRAGFRSNQIGIITRDKSRASRKIESDESMVEEGAAAGAVAGAGIGALIGLGILSGVLPAIGPAIAGGTLGVLLSNVAAGAAVAGLAGALIGLGIPEVDAQWYEKELKAGRTIVTVNTQSRQEQARKILRRNNGYDVSSIEETAGGRATASTTTDRDTERTLELHEERLEARKQPTKKGEVKVRKEVVTAHETVDVPVTREEVFIERRPAGSRRTSTASIREGEEIRIPVREEQVTVEKTPVTKEEVRVGKRTVTDTKRVSGTVRKEEARIESEGDVNVTNAGTETRIGSRKR